MTTPTNPNSNTAGQPTKAAQATGSGTASKSPTPSSVGQASQGPRVAGGATEAHPSAAAGMGGTVDTKGAANHLSATASKVNEPRNGPGTTPTPKFPGSSLEEARNLINQAVQLLINDAEEKYKGNPDALLNARRVIRNDVENLCAGALENV